MAVEGYEVNKFHGPTKRYCQTMDLKNDPVLIAEYINRHSRENASPEIREEIRSVGILEMEIYIWDNRLFMIVETPVDLDWDTAMNKLSILPSQQEWEDLMSVFQQCNEGDAASEKWNMMERMFHLYE